MLFLPRQTFLWLFIIQVLESMRLCKKWKVCTTYKQSWVNQSRVKGILTQVSFLLFGVLVSPPWTPGSRQGTLMATWSCRPRWRRRISWRQWPWSWRFTLLQAHCLSNENLTQLNFTLVDTSWSRIWRKRGLRISFRCNSEILPQLLFSWSLSRNLCEAEDVVLCYHVLLWSVY